jgi:hypothetical protein
MTYDQKALSFLDKPFNDTEEANGGGRVPDGDYLTEIESAELTNSKAGNPMLKWTLTVDEGSHKGGTLFTQNMIPQKGDTKEQANKRLGFLKHNLKMAGVDVNGRDFSLSTFLTSQLSTLQGVKIKVRAETPEGEKYPNVYLNEFISKPDGEHFGGSENDGEREDPFKDQ